LMFVFSLFKEMKAVYKITFVSSILIVGILTLVITRKHYTVFYHQPYQEQMVNTYKALDIIGNEKKATIELVIPPLFKEHYVKKYNRDFKSIYYNIFDEKMHTFTFRKFVDSLTTDYFIFGNPPLEYIQIIKEKYPYLMMKEEGFTYSFYCFAKQKPTNEIHEQVVFTKKLDVTNGTNKMDSTIEYGPAYSEKLKAISNNRHNILTISATVSSTALDANPTIVADIQENDNSLYWNGADYFFYHTNPTGPNTMYISKLMTDFDLKGYPRPQIKIYLWNRNKKNIKVDDVTLTVTKGNSSIYGLFEPLD
jgi:hypothetical protein